MNQVSRERLIGGGSGGTSSDEQGENDEAVLEMMSRNSVASKLENLGHALGDLALVFLAVVEPLAGPHDCHGVDETDTVY